MLLLPLPLALALLALVAQEWGRELRCCICCALCCGPILTLVGLIFLISAIKDTRGDNIKKFNTGVVAWNSAGRAAWDVLGATISMSVQGGANGSRALFVGTNVDPIRPPTDSKVTTYTPLLFVSPANAVPAGYPPQVANGSLSSSATVQIDLYAGSNLLATGAVPLFNLVQTNLGTTSGSTQSTSSTSPSPPRPPPPPPSPPSFRVDYASQICRVVESATNYGPGTGCFAAFGSDFAAGVFDRSSCGIQVTTSPANVVGCTALYSVSVTVRSSTDPLIVGFANRACGFSPKAGCSFGLSRAAKITIGIILFGVGVCWTCCVYGGLYAVVVYFINKNKAGK